MSTCMIRWKKAKQKQTKQTNTNKQSKIKNKPKRSKANKNKQNHLYIDLFFLNWFNLSYKCDTEHNCACHFNRVIFMKYDKSTVLLTSPAWHRWQNIVSPDLLRVLRWSRFHIHYSEDVDCFQTNNYIEYFKLNVDDEDYNYDIRKAWR